MKIASNPFTPKSGMEPRVFLGREKELATFCTQLERAENNYYNHYIVLGKWGIGKTTLLKEYKKIAQTQGILTSFVSIREYTERELIVPAVQLITHIPRGLPIKFEKIKNFAKYLNGLGITLPVIGGGIQLPSKPEYKGDPQVLLLDALLRLWNELKKEMETLVVLLDDVQNYKIIPEFLTLLKNVLSNEEIVKHTGYLFVLSSTYKGWSKFMQKHHPIGRYFIPIVRLKNLSKGEVIEIVDKTLDSTGVVFEADVKKTIFKYTEGHPFQLQVLCDYLYESQVEGVVRIDSFDSSLDKTLEDLGEIIFTPLYNRASEKEKQILKIMANNYNTKSVDKLMSIAVNKGTDIDKGAFNVLLSRLVEKGIIAKTGRGFYTLPNRLLAEYISRI
jgi:TusA-related sulfurtransferase